MEFPSEELIDGLAAKLERAHPTHFLIWNLSGLDYDTSKFDNQVRSMADDETLVDRLLTVFLCGCVVSGMNGMG